MAIIGNGAQSEFQALAFHHLLGIEKVRLFDLDQAASLKARRQSAGRQHAASRSARSAAEAVRGADIVTTITADKANATILTPDMLEPGMHINAVGRRLPRQDRARRRRAARGTVFVEFEPQTRSRATSSRCLPTSRSRSSGACSRARPPAARDAQEVTVFDSVGFAIEDFSALHVMGEAARDLGIGQTIDLIAASADPKDLFGLLGLDALSLQSVGRQEAA